MSNKSKIAFQGEQGAYSHLASLEIFPNSEVKACSTFEEVFKLAKENYLLKVNLEAIFILNSDPKPF